MSESAGEQNKTVSYHASRPWAVRAFELLCEKWSGSLGADNPRGLPVCEQSVVGKQKEEEEKLSLHV